VLLVTCLLLLALGGGAWTVGQIFAYRGIEVLGAVLVLIAGGAIVLTGLEVRTGAVRTISYETINNSTVPVKEAVQYQYERVEIGEMFGVGILGSLGIGGLVMLLGAILMSQSLTEDL